MARAAASTAAEDWTKAACVCNSKDSLKNATPVTAPAAEWASIRMRRVSSVVASCRFSLEGGEGVVGSAGLGSGTFLDSRSSTSHPTVALLTAVAMPGSMIAQLYGNVPEFWSWVSMKEATRAGKGASCSVAAGLILCSANKRRKRLLPARVFENTCRPVRSAGGSAIRAAYGDDILDLAIHGHKERISQIEAEKQVVHSAARRRSKLCRSTTYRARQERGTRTSGKALGLPVSG